MAVNENNNWGLPIAMRISPSWEAVAASIFFCAKKSNAKQLHLFPEG